jgi:hypothetical protein
MDQDQFECFAIPPHVFAEDEVTVPAAPSATTRRNWVLREMPFLGIEALPSSAFDADPPALGR